MQARARQTLTAGHDQLDQAARDHDAEQQQKDQVEIEEREHQLGIGGDIQPARYDDVGGQARKGRGDRKHQRDAGTDLRLSQPADELVPAGPGWGGRENVP